MKKSKGGVIAGAGSVGIEPKNQQNRLSSVTTLILVAFAKKFKQG